MINAQYRDLKVKPKVSEELAAPETKPSLEDLSLADLEALLEQKKQAMAKGVKQGEFSAPPSKAPSGFMWVYNRGPKRFEWQHNSSVYEIDGHSYGLFPVYVAEHGRRRSLLTLDPMSGISKFQLALPDDEAEYGYPLASTERPRGEVIDRSTSDDPSEFGSADKTRVVVIPIDGTSPVPLAKQGAFPELA